eukprot:7951835-Heterocapsa_arctica.AAC.1
MIKTGVSTPKVDDRLSAVMSDYEVMTEESASKHAKDTKSITEKDEKGDDADYHNLVTGVTQWECPPEHR